MLDLVKTVTQNIGKDDAGLLNARAYFKVAWEILTDDRLKASQCSLDGGSAISKIVEIEKKSNAQFEIQHVKTKQDSEVIEGSDGKKMVLK